MPLSFIGSLPLLDVLSILGKIHIIANLYLFKYSILFMTIPFAGNAINVTPLNGVKVDCWGVIVGSRGLGVTEYFTCLWQDHVTTSRDLQGVH